MSIICFPGPILWTKSIHFETILSIFGFFSTFFGREFDFGLLTTNSGFMPTALHFLSLHAGHFRRQYKSISQLP